MVFGWVGRDMAGACACWRRELWQVKCPPPPGLNTVGFWTGAEGCCIIGEGFARLQACDGALCCLNPGTGRTSLVLYCTSYYCRVVCMDCGDNTCRHELQQRLSALNPALAERVAQLSSSGISSRGAWQRALRAGTAADARKVVQESREATEQVWGACGGCVLLWVCAGVCVFVCGP